MNYYHHQAEAFEPTEQEWQEWIEALPDPVAKSMREKGFENGKTVVAFTRYVMEKNDVGLEEYVRRHMDPQDYAEYKTLVATKQ